MEISLNHEKFSGRETPSHLPQLLVQQIYSTHCMAMNPACVQRVSAAETLCAAYPHLDVELVKISLLLLELCNAGTISGGLEEVFGFLPDIDDEQRLKIRYVMLEAQSAYATGEAKIVRYFSQ